MLDGLIYHISDAVDAMHVATWELMQGAGFCTKTFLAADAWSVWAFT